MEQITGLFSMVAKVGLILGVLALIATILYFRWRAAGQERGI